jgi:hypothetical protein
MQSESIRRDVECVMLNKYGVTNSSYIPDVIDKRRKTSLERYGETNYNKTDDAKERASISLIQNPNMFNREAAIKTMIDRYGVDNYTKTEEYRAKTIAKNNEKYGADFYTQTDEYKKYMEEYHRDNIIRLIGDKGYHDIILDTLNEFKIKCDICFEYFQINRQLFLKRTKVGENPCTICNKISKPRSSYEDELFEYISSLGISNIVKNFKVDRKELDIYLPEYNFGIEINGIYWHSELFIDKNYHINKKEFFNKLGIGVVNIWEDDWLYKKDIIKSRISNLLKKNNNIIYARKCVIKCVSNKECLQFLDENHIQGFVGSKIKLGLYYNNILVSLMTFGSLRRNLGKKSCNNYYELIRFCSIKDTNVVGAGSKLLSFFIREFKPDYILSYQDLCWMETNFYEKLGMTLSHSTEPNYFYSKGKVRYNRFNFRKDKLIKKGFDPNKTEREIMFDMDYLRVYDLGSLVWEYKIAL